MKYNITPQLLEQIAGKQANDKIVADLAKYLPEIMHKYEINNDLRAAHFLGQLAHETDHFKTLQEYASGRAYEGRRDLGNVKRGDGQRYKGRGPIQITGRFNYEKYGRELDIDLVNNPELALEPEISLLIAGQYWKNNNLNEWADKDNTKQITRKINGGYNGLQSRLKLVARAKDAIKNVKLSLLQPKEVSPEPVAPVETLVITATEVPVETPTVVKKTKKTATPVSANPSPVTTQDPEPLSVLYQDSENPVKE